MALIDITAEIKGSSETTVVPVRIISATAALTGASASGLRRPPPPPAAPTPETTEAKTEVPGV